MLDVQSILKDLQDQARAVADKVDVDAHVEKAKSIAKSVKHRVETDPNAQKAALGGGALLALLLATKNGRKILGSVAKTGTVAALGAFAYHTWKTRDDVDETPSDAVETLGYASDDSSDPAFSRAIIETMALAASADNLIDDDERAVISQALSDDGAVPVDLDTIQPSDDAFARIVAAARTPNHAAQLFAAACVATQDTSASEAAFLETLADRLSIHPRQAARMRGSAA